MEDLKTVAKGELGASILRSGGKIREERGISLWKSLERFYKRKVEDLEFRVDDLKLKQANLLDFSPTSTTSLAVKDIDPEDFFNTDNELTLQIRTAKIELEEAKGRYNQLFTGLPTPAVAQTS